jgi:hypothetical protein
MKVADFSALFKMNVLFFIFKNIGIFLRQYGENGKINIRRVEENSSELDL